MIDSELEQIKAVLPTLVDPAAKAILTMLIRIDESLSEINGRLWSLDKTVEQISISGPC